VRAESLYGFIERVLQILMPLRLPSPTDVAIRPDGVIGPNQPARDEVDELARCAGGAAVEDKHSTSVCVASTPARTVGAAHDARSGVRTRAPNGS